MAIYTKTVIFLKTVLELNTFYHPFCVLNFRGGDHKLMGCDILPASCEGLDTIEGSKSHFPTFHCSAKNPWRFRGIFGAEFERRAPIFAVRDIFDAIDLLF